MNAQNTVCPEKKYTLSKGIYCSNKRFLCYVYTFFPDTLYLCQYDNKIDVPLRSFYMFDRSMFNVFHFKNHNFVKVIIEAFVILQAKIFTVLLSQNLCCLSTSLNLCVLNRNPCIFANFLKLKTFRLKPRQRLQYYQYINRTLARQGGTQKNSWFVTSD